MTFISYAQNFEDVMLWRALRHVEKGFYIDIGAQDPVVDSVSLAFYEHGWRGVHIEPTQQYSTKLREARPDEVIEQVAIGSSDGLLTFYEFNDTGLSTADPEIAKRHQVAGYRAILTKVSVVSLDAILDKYGHGPVHWLKLDVEGLEKSVLESWRISTCRPWILIIESTKPLTQEQSHADWEPIVLDKGYSCAYFDGLNKFYVHHDHHELLKSFSAPPNIFDGFVLSGSASQPFYQLVAAKAQQAEAKAQQAETKAQQAEAKTQQAEAKAQQAEAKAQQAEAVVKSIHQSSSWRLTAPLRIVGSNMKKLFLLPKAGKLKIKEKIKLLLTHTKLYINRRPRLRRVALVILARFPALKSRLMQTMGAAFSAHRRLPTEMVNLTPRARHIYADIKTAIELRKKGNT